MFKQWLVFNRNHTNPGGGDVCGQNDWIEGKYEAWGEEHSFPIFWFAFHFIHCISNKGMCEFLYISKESGGGGD